MESGRKVEELEEEIDARTDNQRLPCPPAPSSERREKGKKEGSIFVPP